jgi:hypothetical protein
MVFPYCDTNNEVSCGSLVEFLPRCCAIGKSNLRKDNALIEADTVEGDITVCNVISRGSVKIEGGELQEKPNQ